MPSVSSTIPEARPQVRGASFTVETKVYACPRAGKNFTPFATRSRLAEHLYNTDLLPFIYLPPLQGAGSA